MPRKAKDKIIEDIEEKKVTKSTPSKKSNNTKKVATKNTTSQKESMKKNTSKKNTTARKSTAKTAAKEKNTEKSNSKKVSSVTKVSKKNTQKKSTRTSKTRATAASKAIGEYYDLPSNYNQTLVKILAQTPTILFVYWDISEDDKQKLLQHYGKNFFLDTTPYLLVKNITMNYEFEVDINDYANSWYLHIPHPDCKYEVLLMRKTKNYQAYSENNIFITSSNMLETPNDHILFEKLGKTVFFKNVKTNEIEEKDIASFSIIHNIGRIYNIYDLYKEIYQNELKGDELGVTLSSSQFSSNFKI